MSLKPAQIDLLDAISASTDDPEMLDAIEELLNQDYSPRIMPYGTVRGRQRMNKDTRTLVRLIEKASRAQDAYSGDPGRVMNSLYHFRPGSRYAAPDGGERSDPLGSTIGYDASDRELTGDERQNRLHAVPNPHELATQQGAFDWRKMGF